ncbi:hypothetical protein Tco_0216987 [Tanacetum coccineum]
MSRLFCIFGSYQIRSSSLLINGSFLHGSRGSGWLFYDVGHVWFKIGVPVSSLMVHFYMDLGGSGWLFYDVGRVWFKIGVPLESCTLVEEDILVDNLAKEDILVMGSLMEVDILTDTLEEDFCLVENILLVKEGPLSENILMVSEAPWL